MLVTEQEAREKWCPAARCAGPMHTEAEGTTYNRWPGENGTDAAMLDASSLARCIGSQCMWWRWRDSEWEQTMAEERPSDDGWEINPRQATGRWRRLKPGRRGYCGLAGKAESA